MTRPRLLDLFCGAGGAAMGYYRAGFDVVGVDIKKQPNYPFEFIWDDALEAVTDLACGFDAIHASPPCQHYMRSGMVRKDLAPDLVGQTRIALETAGLPWVIENVPGAPIRPDIVLCGSMFGLGVRRHRWFETNSARDHKDTGDLSRVPENGLLPRAVFWATPTSSDGTGGPGNSGRQGGENLRTQAGGSLNPQWVEWLMGFPTGWTDLEASEMLSFPKSRSGLGSESSRGKQNGER
jgi:hypothetical protein